MVVASLVRSNSKGSVGFLREPERINVLLSRARHGLILTGNATTLRNASSAAARKHWGVVLDQLAASNSIVTGLPAVCQQHGSSLGLLGSAEAFALHAPYGGCTLPCNATLPCGHACKLRCHAYDAGHEKQKCEELVLELCEAGHITTRHCCAAKAACSTCDEIGKLLEEEKDKLRNLVRQLLQLSYCTCTARIPNVPQTYAVPGLTESHQARCLALQVHVENDPCCDFDNTAMSTVCVALRGP